MSTGGIVLFAISAVFAIGGAVFTTTQRNPLRAAMALLVHIIALAGIFLTLHAHLLAALQLLVYAGAVVVLFVFVIMLIGPEAEVTPSEGDEGFSGGVIVRLVSAALMAIVTFAIAGALLKTAAPYVSIAPCAEGAECGQFGGVEGLGTVIYQEAMVPFELVSVLLTVAIIGAIAVARGRSPAEIAEARQLRKEIAEAEAREKAEAEKLSAEVAAGGR